MNCFKSFFYDLSSYLVFQTDILECERLWTASLGIATVLKIDDVLLILERIIADGFSRTFPINSYISDRK